MSVDAETERQNALYDLVYVERIQVEEKIPESGLYLPTDVRRRSAVVSRTAPGFTPRERFSRLHSLARQRTRPASRVVAPSRLARRRHCCRVVDMYARARTRIALL